ncbi:hypothetical protein CDAR_443181, partial [Caerostris darwini]
CTPFDEEEELEDSNPKADSHCPTRIVMEMPHRTDRWGRQLKILQGTKERPNKEDMHFTCALYESVFGVFFSAMNSLLEAPRDR